MANLSTAPRPQAGFTDGSEDVARVRYTLAERLRGNRISGERRRRIANRRSRSVRFYRTQGATVPELMARFDISRRPFVVI